LSHQFVHHLCPQIFIPDADSGILDSEMGSDSGMALDDGEHHLLISFYFYW
jgi:hypothetical protein